MRVCVCVCVCVYKRVGFCEGSRRWVGRCVCGEGGGGRGALMRRRG